MTAHSLCRVLCMQVMLRLRGWMHSGFVTCSAGSEKGLSNIIDTQYQVDSTPCRRTERVPTHISGLGVVFVDKSYLWYLCPLLSQPNGRLHPHPMSLHVTQRHHMSHQVNRHHPASPVTNPSQSHTFTLLWAFHYVTKLDKSEQRYVSFLQQ